MSGPSAIQFSHGSVEPDASTTSCFKAVVRRRRGAGWCCALGHAVAVVGAERAGELLGQRVAVALAVGGAHEGGDDFERPFLDPGGLAPEVGEAKVDVELEQVDA